MLETVFTVRSSRETTCIIYIVYSVCFNGMTSRITVPFGGLWRFIRFLDNSKGRFCSGKLEVWTTCPKCPMVGTKSRFFSADHSGGLPKKSTLVEEREWGCFLSMSSFPPIGGSDKFYREEKSTSTTLRGHWGEEEQEVRGEKMSEIPRLGKEKEQIS